MNHYSTDIETAELGENGLSKNAGWITVYHVHPDTREYLSASDAYLMVGIGLPAHSYPEKPVLPNAGQALRRSLDGLSWEHVPDYRGKTVYNTGTRGASTVEAMGELPGEVTLLAPATECDTWNGSEWVTDTQAQHAADVGAAEKQKAALLAEAQTTISLWQTELQLGIISDEDTASLIAWIKYIKAVQAFDTSKAPDIIWPDKPE